jgi:predicted outer membrane repeat protein
VHSTRARDRVTRFTECHRNAGALYFGGAVAALAISRTTVSRNTALIGGGGLYTFNCGYNISDSSFSENIAKQGGGVFSVESKCGPGICRGQPH